MSYLDTKILEGQNLLRLSPGMVLEKGKSDVGILGKDGTGIGLHPGLFSKHILTLGAIGSGKSNTMYHIVKVIRQKMDQNDVMVFFDAKGDYLEEFYKDGDYVISNSLTPPPGLCHWNIYKDILYTPKEKREEAIREIASSLLKEDIENSQAPVFGMGARDLLAALLTIQVREMEEGKEQWNHQKLVAYMQKAHDAVLRNLFLDNPEFMWLRNYIQKDGGSTTQSFLVHLYQTVFKIFSGSFGKAGDFSIREIVTQKGGKAVFLEYDLSSGNILDPVYTILLDLAMKEVLGRSKTDGNVYFILDEFPLIPKLNYMDNALNFGRSLGVKVIAGIQNIGQVKHRYGDSLAYSMLSGFGTIFAFRLFDEESRSFVSQRHGAVKRLITLASTIVNKGAQDQLIDGKVIEDWDITNLNVGECIVSMPQGEPFLFYPVLYEHLKV